MATAASSAPHRARHNRSRLLASSLPGLLALLPALALPAAAQDCDPHMALRFDGVDDFVDVVDPQALPLEKFTVGAWIRALSFGGERRGIVTRGEDPVTDHLPWALELWIDGTLAVEIEDGADNNLFWFGATNVADGEWHHVAASRAGDGTLTLFVDGEVDAVHAATLTPIDGAGAARLGNLRLNALGVPSEYGHFDGFLDEAFVYGEALDPDLVKKIYLAGVDAAYGDLQLLLKLDEFSGQKLDDSSINDHTGVLGFDTNPEAADPLHVVSQAPICDKVQKLWFNLEPPVAGPGAEVQALTWGGAPFGLNALVITSIDGFPLFAVALIDAFDAAGEHFLQVDLPSDAPTGITVGITAWGKTASGKLKPSHEEFLVLQ